MNTDNSTAAHIIYTAIVSHNILRKTENIYEYLRWRETQKLFLPIARKLASDNRFLAHGLDPYQPKFRGHNPLTGLPVVVVFDEPRPGASSILQWSPALNSWTYSDNAGVKWQRVEFMDYIEKADCLMNEPEYTGIEAQ